jgi:putative transferase (TIGR04331 family)
LSKKFLVLGQMPENATPETHIPAGQWCFMGVENLYPDWDEKFTSLSIYNNDADVYEREGLRARCWGVRQIESIATNLGGGPLDIWEFVLGRWAIFAAHKIHDSLLRLEKIIDLYRDQYLTVFLVSKFPMLIFQDYRECFYDFMSPSGIHWLYSRLLEHIDIPDKWNIEYTENHKPPPKEQTDFRQRSTIQNRSFEIIRIADILFFLIRFIRRFSRKVKQTVDAHLHILRTHIPLPSCLLDSFFFIIILIPFLLMNRRRIDNTKPLCKEFSDFVELPAYYAEIMMMMIPESFKNFSPNKKKRSIFKTFITDHTFFSTDARIFKMACYKLAGVRIVTTQHAPGYVPFLKSSGQRLEGVYHTFVPWGNLPFTWRQARSAPNITYTHLYNKHKSANNVLLYVMDIERPLSHDIELSYRINVVENRSFHKTLINKIEESIGNDQGRIFLRPYPASPSSFDSETWVKKNWPNLYIFQGNLLDGLRRCKLSVVTYMGSVQGQALALNTPMVWVWDNTALPLTNEARELFKYLGDVKIYFSDPLLAAKHIKAIWTDVDSWWNSKDVQTARSYFLKIDMGLPCRMPLRQWINTVVTV